LSAFPSIPDVSSTYLTFTSQLWKSLIAAIHFSISVLSLAHKLTNTSFYGIFLPVVADPTATLFFLALPLITWKQCTFSQF
jgi:hypothetical protein